MIKIDLQLEEREHGVSVMVHGSGDGTKYEYLLGAVAKIADALGLKEGRFAMTMLQNTWRLMDGKAEGPGAGDEGNRGENAPAQDGNEGENGGEARGENAPARKEAGDGLGQ